MGGTIRSRLTDFLTAFLTASVTGCRRRRQRVHTRGVKDTPALGPSDASPKCPRCRRTVATTPRRWWCPSCGEGGSAVDFRMLRESCTAETARRHLAPTPAGGSATTAPRAAPVEVDVGGSPLVIDAAADATVADVLGALGWTGDALLVDGRRHEAHEALSGIGLARGATVAPVGATRAVPEAVFVLRWCRGLDAGRFDRLAPGPSVIGRGPRAHLHVDDPSIARYHALLDVGPAGVRLRALAAGAGTGPALVRVGDELRFGDCRARLTPAPTAVTPSAVTPSPGVGGRASIHRPPRTLPPPPPMAVTVPVADRSPGRPIGLGWSGALAGIVAGVAMSLVLHNPMVLALSAVGAVGSVSGALTVHRRQRRDRRDAIRTSARDLARFTAELAAARSAHCAQRRDGVPEIDETVRRSVESDARLWERRRHHGDAFAVLLGHGDEPWDPPFDGPAPPAGTPLGAAIAGHLFLPDVPITAVVGPGAVLGLCGPAPIVSAVARSIVVQVAVHHGPADVEIAVDVGPCERGGWGWSAWLPHIGVAEMALDERAELMSGRHLLVVTGAAALVARTSPLRRALVAGRVGVVVTAQRADALPASCTEIVELSRDGAGRIRQAGDVDDRCSFRAVGVSVATAATVARALAPLEDPERDAAAAVPDEVRLVELLGEASLDVETLARTWSSPNERAPCAPIGRASDGIVELDLRRDGPHALVVGTTGSGKSELLRTIVAGLAVRCRPDEVSFVLVDYKGGSAFDACAELPHVVGVVTDLDEVEAARALRSLEAEITRRERVLRSAGASDLASGGHGLGRLVIVVDEFATLAAELPDFLSALVSVAQRGRSLGLHLLLATQRLGGSLRDDIRANTNCRIALRVQSPAESLDVLGAPDAAAIPRRCPGRAWMRLGPGELVGFQSACASRSSPPSERPPVVIGGRDDADAWSAGPTELERLVQTAVAAHGRLGLSLPRRPWTDPLPPVVTLDDLPAGDMVLVDEPDEQRQWPARWRPESGHLVVVGPPGTGRSTALVTAVLALTGQHEPDAVHVYVLDLGSGALAPLGELPHCGAVVRAGDDERRRRLFRWLAAERRRRLASGLATSEPRLVVVVDGLAPLLALANDVGEHDSIDTFAGLALDGTSVGIHLAVSADREASVPAPLLTAAGARWTLGDDDRAERRPPGRARDARRRSVQIARAIDVASAVAERAAPAPRARRPHPIGTLPTTVDLADLPTPRVETWPLALPIGIGDHELDVVSLRLHDGDHVVVTGPARTGKSVALVALATQLRQARPDAVIVGVCPRASPLADCSALDDCWNALSRSTGTPPMFLLVDDADRVDDVEPLLSLGGTVFAAATADALRSAYGHWTQRVRRSRCGLLLRPDVDLDGELLGVSLPRRVPIAAVPGRGYLVQDGGCELVQIARTDSFTSDRGRDSAGRRRG